MRDVFIWREMPDWQRLKPYPENEHYRRWFYSRWGRENAVISGRSRNIEYAPFRQRLSVKLARGGRELYFIDGRTIAVDDDSYLILNDERTYSSQFESDVEIESFSIFFRPGMAEEVFGALGTTVEGALAAGSQEAPRAVEFAEILQSHDTVVTPALRYVQYGVETGIADAGWYEEQFQFLLERMLTNHRRLIERIQRMTALKSATRREIHRRLALAIDLVHAGYERDIGLAEMAQAACLSKYHFLRLFTELHGITPHAYLQRKRALVAARLLESSGLTTLEVAERTGFGSRSTMSRQLRRWTGA